MTADSRPRVSILLPAYNAENYLQEALDDLLHQTFSDFELVAVDDGSTDATLEIFERAANEDPRVVVLSGEPNRGLSTALNRGLARCRAPLVARADADDRYAAERLERQVRFLDAHPEVGLLSCAAQRMTEDAVPLGVARFPTEDGPIRLRELFVNSFCSPGVVFRTDLVRELGGFDPAYRFGEDGDMWDRLRQVTKAANLPEVLVHYRILASSLTRSTMSERERQGPVVRRRALARYLERPVSLEEAESMVTTFHARRESMGTASQLRVGLAGMQEVLSRASVREDAATVAYFRRACALALLQHADFRRDREPASAWQLYVRALRWWPRLAASRRGLGQARRCASSTAHRLLPIGGR
ncbi:glycosyltransferase family 2 protein [Egicoccus halophilus]|uniref:Glycosyltransferase 2-like domain-containing protein n=1 Tax=Egicoccus halophilus TaxID=1670830 RepID=A0A8J3ERP1_9ACTN|nr:glycosyltransferase [Egicoccus halophilus]GGI05380.1 hypothetical protein GCM10011354_13810 [Egicoccus halophilus]